MYYDISQGSSSHGHMLTYTLRYTFLGVLKLANFAILMQLTAKMDTQEISGGF